MSPLTAKLLAYAVVVTAIVAHLAPVAGDLAGLAPPTWVKAIVSVTGIAATIHAWLIASPLLTPLLSRKAP